MITTQNKKKYSIDPRAQLLILILINVIGLVSSSPKMECIMMGVLSAILLQQKQGKKCIKFLMTYLLVWGFIFSSIVWPNILTGMLAMIGVMGRKTVPIFMFASSIIATTKIGRLIGALQEIHMPKGIVIGLAVAMRFFPTIKEEGRVVIQSMKMRGLNVSLKHILIHPILVMKNILIPLMLRMTIIADDLAISSITRGIDSDKKRTSYYKNVFSVYDMLLILIFMSMLLLACMEVV